MLLCLVSSPDFALASTHANAEADIWRPLPDWLGGEQPYDLNSWQESETAIALAETLDEDAVIVEGYAEYATWRPHLAYLRDPYGDPDVEMELDGVGGVSILAKARVFRSGVHFPAFSFERHAETEGFGKMARRMQYSVVGLPHYTVWHLYEPSVDDIKHMEEMEAEKRERERQEKEAADKAKKLQDDFEHVGSQWEKDKQSIAESGKKNLGALNAANLAAVDAATEVVASDGSKEKVAKTGLEKKAPRKESVRKINTRQGDKKKELGDEIVEKIEKAESVMSNDEAVNPVAAPAEEPKAGKKKGYQ